MTDPQRSVCVIIPAHNASATIAGAVRSALDQPEVAEVIVVDDASQDDTAAAAEAVSPGDPRLKVLRQKKNVGPALARNLAIDQATAPLIAILDADDYFLPGRFAPLLEQSGCDIIADNIVFVPESRPDFVTREELDAPRSPKATVIGLAAFLHGNIPDAAVRRGELGFLKPVLSRAFLDKHGLRYDPSLRLGEDFVLYLEMLVRGARFSVLPNVGYVARVRPDSLSGRHGADDLRHLFQASLQLQKKIGAKKEDRRAMQAYLRALRARYLLHAFLEIKRESGLASAARHALVPPYNAWPIARGVLRDKLAAAFGARGAQPVLPSRYLLPLE
ncbi:glycosyltransferase family 2 protein [Salipiger abyssi]|uniref:glycosyltransferase family 2 protein n=1 Tax=Salipiger abyssi TaxID=1250539 RepID=UPI001A8F4290|nr:glycosyltransferase family 2 protein [Salipiger abyssi]MBN9886286.1 glycosyltransferase family 2 protein [Salipiger abyssi]